MNDVFWNAGTATVPQNAYAVAYLPVRVQGSASDGSQDIFRQIALSDILTGVGPLQIAIALPAGWALVSAVLLALTPSDRQTLRVALTDINDMDDIAIRLRGGWVAQNDPLGQFIGTALYGDPGAAALTTLFATARAASAPPFTYNLAPIALGGLLTDA